MKIEIYKKGLWNWTLIPESASEEFDIRDARAKHPIMFLQAGECLSRRTAENQARRNCNRVHKASGYLASIKKEAEKSKYTIDC